MEKVSKKIVEVRQVPITSNILRTVLTIAGLIFAIISAIMMLTIVLFIPGIFGVLIGLVVAILSAPKTPVNCPYCLTENKATFKAKSFKCDGCAETVPIRWKDESKWTSWSTWRRKKDDKKEA